MGCPGGFPKSIRTDFGAENSIVGPMQQFLCNENSSFIQGTKFKEVLIEHIITSLDTLKAAHPEAGVLVLGDFNRLNINPLCRAHSLKQIIDEPTRGDAILDLVITNLKNYYKKPIVCSPIGRSDHNTIYLPPIGCSKTGKQIKRLVRPLRKHCIYEFGRWITNHPWYEVLDASSTSDKADAFYTTVQDAIDNHFPTKLIKHHSQDKPWISTEIKDLIRKRQIAFAEKKMFLWRFLRNKVIRIIDQAKKFHYRDRIQNLKSSDPSGWHKGIQLITNKCQLRAIITVPGVQPDDNKAIAEAISNEFASVTQGRPPINLKRLPTFLPANAPPKIEVWEMYNNLKNLKSKKAAGPDGLPGRLLKEFACEFSVPVCDLFNSSLKEGIVPKMWKDATISPIPKTTPASISKLRPISLTSILAKVCEGFVSNWVMEDIGTDKGKNVGTLIVTDFSKAFDCIDHTLAIQRLFELGVRSELLPWITNFLTSRRQRVQYHSALSRWETLSCGVPQGTKLGPIIFMVVINNASEESLAESFKYVDDLSLVEVRPANQPSQIGVDVQDLDAWATDNRLELNPSKCKAMQTTNESSLRTVGSAGRRSGETKFYP
ncbi:uncharacterized protein [Antedon mediterranea]|uniref:uncharacterized protein n=1 Tax=Antedon mediterranea TaxID=105859 RepID=UPI003AF5AAAB